ncbi:MAG: carbohydrate ABC transporter permease, partial [Rhodospirillales bacterium]|nr:carbohydrate ABC transporter permease [Rhodospirillales bacterium]
MNDAVSEDAAFAAPQNARARRLRRERRNAVLRHAALIAWSAVVIFPIFWMVSTSFKDSGEWVTWPPHWLPQAPTLHNYTQIFSFSAMDSSLSRQATEQAFSIWKGLGDSVLVCTVSSLAALLLGTFLAYSISRFNVGGKYFRHMILTIRMVPPIVVA